MKKMLMLFSALILVMILSGAVYAQTPYNQIISFASYQLQNEEQVFYCPTDENVVIATWRDFRLGYRRCGIGRTTDGGVNWTDMLNNLMLDIDSWQSDPVMTVDAAGNFYLCFLDYKSPLFMIDSSFIVFIKSTDKGASWTGAYKVSESHGEWFEDKQFIAADRTGGPHDGNVYVAWARFPNPTRMIFARSIDGGITFEDTLIVGPSQYHAPCGSNPYDAGQFAQPMVGSDGAVYVFWTGNEFFSDECQAYYVMKMSKSTDGGQTWPIMEVPIFYHSYVGSVDGGIDVYNSAAGDVDITGGPYDGNIYISLTNGNTNDIYYHADVIMIKSTDGGQTWLPPTRINDDPLGYDMDQFHPWLIVNEDGVIATIFYDQRMDVNHYLFDVFAAYSFDGGETFTTNQRITDVSSSPGDLKKSSTYPDGSSAVYDPHEGRFDDEGIYHAVQPKAGLIAEYIGVTAHHDNITAVWTDARNGNQDVFSASFSLPFLKPRLYGLAGGEFVNIVEDSLFWSTCWHEGDVSYRVEIDDDPDFSSITSSQTPTDNKFFTNSLGLTDGLYYWRVKAFRTSVDDSTEYSAVWSFELDTQAPNPATPQTPGAMEIVDQPSPEFIWAVDKDDASAPEYFEIEISDDPAFSGAAPYFHYDNIVTTSFAMPDVLPSEGIYYWHVNHYDQVGNQSGYSANESFEFLLFLCGDANMDGTVNLADAGFIVNYIFYSGPAPDPIEAGDANGDGTVNLADAGYIVNYIFYSGADPICP